ncbi:tetratricopeptide repeat protein [Ruegeria sp. ANG-R]|uniref:tetratricopeptide repeat protein n=1 Tax=Ruegeria sp. ANG-R TaxID=1577903 RepID=UPI00068D9521|nr:tetratricopeptide repeat protein [Ruegeria sp. ANG-R]
MCIALTACKTAEERAEAHFVSAQELIEIGDLDRAIVELRNVFQLVPNHAEARRAMAQVMEENGDVAGAYSQYIRLIEQVPDDIDGRTALAELAFGAGDWDEFTRHGKQVVELAPDAARSQPVDIALQYRDAILEQDRPAIEALAMRAKSLAAEMPESNLLEHVVFDSYLRANNPEKALAQLDIMIARAPQNRSYYDQRLLLLQRVGDRDVMEGHLREVIARFPEDADAKGALVQFLLATGDREGAETYLRSIGDPANPDPTFFISLVRFLKEVHGNDAARAEIDAALDVYPEPDQLRILRATLDFEDGYRDKAISDLQSILHQNGEDTEALDLANEARLSLARMLVINGDSAGAQQLVEEVLAADGDDVEALKMRATRLIGADDTNGAISDLRRALNVDPEDVQALGLMADAHIRAGSHDLARDFLAQAVDVSDSAPDTSLRYAQMLAASDNYASAEEVLLSGLRRTPRDVEILSFLGDIYLATNDFGRASMAVRQLRQIGSETSEAAANRLQVQLLASQQGTEAALTYLEELVESADAGIQEKAVLLRAQLSAGQHEAALQTAQELVADAPEDPERRFLLANTLAGTGDLEAARTLMRTLVSEDPTRAKVWQQLYRIAQIDGDAAAASALLDEALKAAPEAPVLLWAKAGELERAGDIDATIAIYEKLYAKNSESVIFANNLASLLVTYNEDPESVERAWAIARRLRDTDVPAFQDTYGWLAFRRGDLETALSYLESAAAGVPQDPIVQYHLAEVYAALDRPSEALATYQRVLELAEANDTRPQIIRAQEARARLQEADLDTENQ